MRHVRLISENSAAAAAARRPSSSRPRTPSGIGRRYAPRHSCGDRNAHETETAAPGRPAGAFAASLCAIAGLVLIALVLRSPDASAQTIAVCNNSPGAGERVECTEDATSTNDIDIDLDDVDIDTSGDSPGTHGLHVRHRGTGRISIDVRDSMVTDSDRGIYA